MKYYSTNRSIEPVTFREAVTTGLPADNGLFMPEKIPQLSKSFLSELREMTLAEIGTEIAQQFVDSEIEKHKVYDIVYETLNFSIPLVNVTENIYSLELFHGPTCAFKDVGARFLARCLGHFSQDKVTVLVATSGDTGSAVASGFLGVPNVDVVILYPSGKVSNLQEKQLTTHGQNIDAIEVAGNFDDCQRLVKKAFLDPDLIRKKKLTSANSINIARLIPQSFYYFWALAQLPGSPEIMISVPSGNYGNLTAGMLAKAMGLPVTQFIASSNINDVVPRFLHTGNFEPHPSRYTISNAMDVGNPSNFTRMMAIKGSYEKLAREVLGCSFTDEQTRQIIRKTYAHEGYLLDPHGAVGLLGLQEKWVKGRTGIFLETAHPAKFADKIEDLVGKIEIPERLQIFLNKEKRSIPMSNDFEELKEYLLA